MSYNLFDKVNSVLEGDDKTIHMPPIPEEITSFLGKLSLLEGVPVYNLIADKRYLPLTVDDDLKETGSLKFFWVDPEWIEGLLSGALSIAGEDNELMLKKAMHGQYTAEVFYKEATEKVKRQISGLYAPEQFEKQLTERLLMKKIVYGDPKPTAEQSNWRYTGFFMRSSIISKWKEVEIIAYGEAQEKKGVKEKLQVIRLEKVAGDCVYCICEGVISWIEIIQPHETTHFDIKEIKPVMRTAAKGVLNIKETLKVMNENIEKEAPVKDGVKEKPELITNSAKLAKALLSKPFRTTLTIKREN